LLEIQETFIRGTKIAGNSFKGWRELLAIMAFLLRGRGSCWLYWQLCSGVEGVAGNTGNSVHGSNLLFAGTPENIK
jgi:hypothetical protein